MLLRMIIQPSVIRMRFVLVSDDLEGDSLASTET